MVQTGGSPNSVDNLVALEIQQNTGTKWKYLSFDDGAPRITAMLRGDAQIDIGALPDFADQIDAGKLKLIGVFSDKRLPTTPTCRPSPSRRSISASSPTISSSAASPGRPRCPTTP